MGALHSYDDQDHFELNRLLNRTFTVPAVRVPITAAAYRAERADYRKLAKERSINYERKKRYAPPRPAAGAGESP